MFIARRGGEEQYWLREESGPICTAAAEKLSVSIGPLGGCSEAGLVAQSPPIANAIPLLLSSALLSSAAPRRPSARCPPSSAVLSPLEAGEQRTANDEAGGDRSRHCTPLSDTLRPLLGRPSKEKTTEKRGGITSRSAGHHKTYGMDRGSPVQLRNELVRMVRVGGSTVTLVSTSKFLSAFDNALPYAFDSGYDDAAGLSF